MEVTRENLLTMGYKEYPPGIDKCDRIYQKSFKNNTNNFLRQYFLNFREWSHSDGITFDAQICCDTDTEGHAWLTIKEDSIEATQNRAHALWKACGSVDYDEEY
jgi:hypothetical protein